MRRKYLWRDTASPRFPADNAPRRLTWPGGQSCDGTDKRIAARCHCRARGRPQNRGHQAATRASGPGAEQAKELIELSEKKNKVLLVDHTFVYTGAVRKVKELIDKGQLGDLIYYDSTRANLGLFQQDVDVIWDLAPHDISIMDYLMPFRKLTVSATGSHFYGNHLVPKALLTIYMENNIVAHINVSWVSPVKIRDTFIAGTSKMVLYDDNQPSEKIKIYDKGVELYETKEELYHLKVQYRVGDMYAPKLEDHEALAFETEHFADCLLNGKRPLTGGKAGLEVVKVLVGSKKSLQANGAPVDIA